MSKEPAKQNEPIPRVDTLTDEQLEDLNLKFRLVSLIKAGLRPRDALERLAAECPGLNYTARWAEKLYRRYEEHGAQALVDRRWQRRTEFVVFAPDLKELTLAWYHARPAAGPLAIWKQIKEECERTNRPVPGYDSVRKFLKALPEHHKMVRGGRFRIYDKQARPVVRYDITSYANERWQLDHTRLDIWAREKIQGEWRPCQLWLTVALDAHSRTIPGFILSKKCPDSWTTALLLRRAILPKQNEAWLNKGLPMVLQPDRGQDFLSRAVAASLAYLGIVLDPDPPYYPNRKGKVERWFQTLDTGCLRILPGHSRAVGAAAATAQRYIAELLTREQIERAIEHWIVTDYHRRVHSETGRAPEDLWRETVRLRMPQCEDALDNCLLKSDVTRTVRNTGIDFHPQGNSTGELRGGRYWAPELAYYVGQHVRLRYNPEDLESVLVYDATGGEYICEAWLMGGENAHYTIADVKRCRSQFRRGLKERIGDYMQEIKREDRRAARRAELADARAMADAMVAEPAPETPDPLRSEVDALIDEFERQDRASSEGI
jgi:putative transposase